MSNEVIDLRDFPFMPLHIERLRRSKAWLECKKHPELAFYLFNLWMRSWHEVPAGSVEDDDDVLADAAMCSMPRWLKIRDQVLRNWEKKEDGRLYHTTVTEIAAESWQGKIRQRNRTAAARAAKLLPKPTEDVTTSVTEPVTQSVTENVTSSKGREGKGSRREKESEEDTADAVPSPVYAFESGVIRLSQKDFGQWFEAYSFLDLRAELLSLTDFAQKNPEKWFFAVAGALAKRNREAKLAKERVGKGEFRLMSGIEGVL